MLFFYIRCSLQLRRSHCANKHSEVRTEIKQIQVQQCEKQWSYATVGIMQCRGAFYIWHFVFDVCHCGGHWFFWEIVVAISHIQQIQTEHWWRGCLHLSHVFPIAVQSKPQAGLLFFSSLCDGYTNSLKICASDLDSFMHFLADSLFVASFCCFDGWLTSPHVALILAFNLLLHGGIPLLVLLVAWGVQLVARHLGSHCCTLHLNALCDGDSRHIRQCCIHIFSPQRYQVSSIVLFKFQIIFFSRANTSAL